jgi:5-amino-6-(5-phospho-D-ribitylamino)uracil phosphatase
MSNKKSPARSGRDMLLDVLLAPDDTWESGKPEPVRGDRGRPAIKLVAIDLDGTLLNDSKQVSSQTVAGLKGLPEKGIKVVIASARPPRSVRHIYSALGLDTLSIHYNGALIWDEPKQKVVHHTPMPGALVHQMITAARAQHPDVLVSCEVLDRWFTDRFEQSYTTETGRMFKPDVIAPLNQFCGQPITKLMLLGPSAMIDVVGQSMADLFHQHVSVVRCDPELVQIMDKRASKGVALHAVAKHYGIPMGQVMAIGDAANDVEMLDAAGVGVAMDNAHPKVKAIADFICPSNNDHGVHAALMYFDLCE